MEITISYRLALLWLSKDNVLVELRADDENASDSSESVPSVRLSWGGRIPLSTCSQIS